MIEVSGEEEQELLVCAALGGEMGSEWIFPLS